MIPDLVGLLLAILFMLVMVYGIADKNFGNTIAYKATTLTLASLLTGIFFVLSFAPNASGWTYACAVLWFCNLLFRYFDTMAHDD